MLWLNFSPLQKDMSFVHQSQNNQGYWLSYISSKLLHLGAHTLISKPASVRKVAKMLKNLSFTACYTNFDGLLRYSATTIVVADFFSSQCKLMLIKRSVQK